MDFRPICVRGPIDETTAQVAEAIWEGTLPAGARLPPERALAERLGISRPTLRVALRTLADLGLLAITRGRGGGAVVRSEVVPIDLLWSGPKLDMAGVGAVLEARRSLEPQVAQLAARNATGEDLDKLRRLVQRQRDAPRDPALQQQIDVRFHLAIARATHNPAIWPIAKELQLRVAAARHAMRRTPVDPRTVAEVHQATLDAIAGGDQAVIERQMHDHLSWLERRWERERNGSALG
jgi:GntR family transcriptional regulator, transcriptional repressor for pyruvate dehydrogenase complex